jgi:hypothetical protein
MKKIKNILCFTLLAVLFTACDINDRNYDDVVEVDRTGGILSLDKTLIGYVVGDNATYTASGNVYQGNVTTQTIEIYNSFTSSATGNTTNEVLLATVPVSELTTGSNSAFSADFTYEQLISGLELEGAPLPTSDGELTIGDFWNLRYVSKTSTGGSNTNYRTTKISVGTRFSGTYRPVAGEYYRIGVPTYDLADWLNFCPETVIESVDATTYRVKEYFGPFNGNEWYFQINGDDSITYPLNTPSGDAQTGNGQPFITCQSNPADMTNVPCGAGSNVVIRDNVNGADQLVMTFGYDTPGSGSREFYQILEKIVD